MHRYTWEDSVVDAQAAGRISNGALLVCLKLARAINWNPKDNRPAGLYWKNADAFRAVGLSRTTFYDRRKELLDSGYLVVKGGNLLPQLPEESEIRTVNDTQESEIRTVSNDAETTQESEVRTPESEVRTEKSGIRTAKSEVRHPFSEDIFSEEELSVNSLSEREPVVADATPDSVTKTQIKEDPLSLECKEGIPSSLNHEGEAVVLIEVEKRPQSEIRTIEEDAPEGAVRRVDYESQYTHAGWLYKTQAAAERARRETPALVDAEW